MNYAELIEGFEVVIAVLLEKMSICEFYAGIFTGVDLPLRSTANNFQPQSVPDSALPELYAALIVFAVKARAYFEAKGMCDGNALYPVIHHVCYLEPSAIFISQCALPPLLPIAT